MIQVATLREIERVRRSRNHRRSSDVMRASDLGWGSFGWGGAQVARRVFYNPHVPLQNKCDIGYWHADDIIASVGSSVNSWAPRFGSYTLGDTLSPPTLESWGGWQGGKCVYFDGSLTQYLKNASMSSIMNGEDQPITVAMEVVQTPTAAAAQTMLGWGSATSSSNKNVFYNGAAPHSFRQQRNTTIVTDFTSQADTNRRVIIWRDNGTTQRLHVDDGTDPTGAVDVGALSLIDVFMIGAQQHSSGIVNPSTFQIKWLWMSTQDLDATDRAYLYDLAAGNYRDGVLFADSQPYDLLIWTGQSNVQTHQVTGTPVGFPRSDVRNWVNSLNNWVYESQALESLSSKDVSGTSYYGPWLEGSATVKDTRSTTPMLSIMVGKGATLLGNWLETTIGANVVWPTLNAATRGAKVRMGGNPTNVHYIFIQGEADAQVSNVATYYESQLTQMASEQRAHHGAGMHVHILELHSGMSGTPYGADVRAAQSAFVAADANASLITISDLATGTYMQGDVVHYNAAGVAEIASRMATSILAHS